MNISKEELSGLAGAHAMTAREVSSERLPEYCPRCDLNWSDHPPAIVAGTDKARCIHCKSVFDFPVSSERVSEEARGKVREEILRSAKILRPEELALTVDDVLDRALRSSVKTVGVDDLAQEIRRVDGSNDLGAGQLAEALMPFLSAIEAPAASSEVTEEMVDRAWQAYDAKSGYSKPERFRAALTAALKGDRS